MTNTDLASVRVLLEANKQLELALMEQWIVNHAERCSNEFPPWPCKSATGCHAPLPPVLAAKKPAEIIALVNAVISHSE